LYPLRSDADRVSRSGFSDFEANALLLAAFLHGDVLVERLMQSALVGSISASKRDARLQTLQAELTKLRYDEEATISALIAAGDDSVTRSSAQPWAVLMVEVVSDEAQAAA
jgi:hypothetical protein